ncbi:hypothetical protein TNCV_2540591 [Trichonephila clavipes]|nr:hypothetical protein TNCV_2540591 [Trichonephila clavipes]
MRHANQTDAKPIQGYYGNCKSGNAQEQALTQPPYLILPHSRWIGHRNVDVNILYYFLSCLLQPQELYLIEDSRLGLQSNLCLKSGFFQRLMTKELSTRETFIAKSTKTREKTQRLKKETALSEKKEEYHV